MEGRRERPSIASEFGDRILAFEHVWGSKEDRDLDRPKRTDFVVLAHLLFPGAPLKI